MALIKSSHDLQPRRPAPATGPVRVPEWAMGFTLALPVAPPAIAATSRYCYLFPDLAADPAAGRFDGTDDAETLARLKAFEVSTRLPSLPPSAITIALPAAYTYFGQFLNHDISAPETDDATPELSPAGIIGSAEPPGLAATTRADPATILSTLVNQHHAPLTLDSLYADGPDSPDPEVAALYAPDGKRFRLAVTSRAPESQFTDLGIDPATVIHASGAPDIPRLGQTALIADRRNDGNLILSQLHLALMLAHNRAVDGIDNRKTGNPMTDRAECFSAARRLVTLHYHWLILHDFLPRLLSQKVLTHPLTDWTPRLPTTGEVPMEFTTAAYRFGHSLVGRNYDFNANFGQDGRISPSASLMDLFNFTSQQNMGQVVGDTATAQLPDHWVIEWDRLTREPVANAAPVAPETAHGRAERIDLHFAPDMLNVAGDAMVPEHGSILFRNLMRGFHRRMPFGQALARACGIPPLTPDQLRAAMPRYLSTAGDDASPAAAAERLGLIAQTPAWLYLICESDVLEDGTRLGPTASTIIADTVVGLMRANPASLLGDAAGWHPKDSPLKAADGQPLTTLRGFLHWATAA
jgi:hypothetical protein